MGPRINVDVLIIGGGACGLWCARRLVKSGYSAVVLESSALGSGQTVMSQGILHAGVKYALTGSAGAASQAAARGAQQWGEALAGRGEVDLRGVEVLADEMLLWTGGDMAGRLVLGAAAMAMRSGVRRLKPEEKPAWLRDSGEPAYMASERVVSAPSALRELASGVVIVGVSTIDAVEAGAVEDSGCGRVVRVTTGGAPLEFRAGVVVACAGAGNEGVLRQVGVAPGEVAQRRPLAMVLVRGVPVAVFGHCIGASSTPRLTITSASDGARVCWWVGGQIAEWGASVNDAGVRAEVGAELSRCLPGLDTGGASIEVIRVDRAEGFDERGRRPDGVVVRELRGVMFAWPTKLVLVPEAAREVEGRVRARRLPRVSADEVAERCAGLARPGVARAPWGDPT